MRNYFFRIQLVSTRIQRIAHFRVAVCLSRNKRNLHWEPGMSEHVWIEPAPWDQRDEQHLSRKNSNDTAALSETRLADEGSLKEDGGGYTFFWKGKPQAEDRIHGVGFAIRTALLKNTPALPVGINERLMKVRIPLSKIRYLTVVSAYAPTLTSPDETYQGEVLWTNWLGDQVNYPKWQTYHSRRLQCQGRKRP